MTGQQYNDITQKEGAIPLGHPDFTAAQYHRDYWKQQGVTVVICQRQTKEFTQLCVESILRFYPDIPILVIDGDSQDDSTLYLKYKELTVPNFRLHNHIGRNSHGEILDYTFKNLVETEYALTMDSDTIMVRGGWIEEIREQFNDTPKPYAIGHLMLVTFDGYGCGEPASEEDVLRYAHPSCAMFHVPTYIDLKEPFNDNGAPLAHNMRKAQEQGFEVRSFPIDRYVVHRTGTSWVKEHKIVWPHDHDVFIRPFVTFLISGENDIFNLQQQTDKDFNCIVTGDNREIKIWETSTRDIDNRFFDMRFSVNGEYVCDLSDGVVVDKDFVTKIKESVIENSAPNELTIGEYTIYKRHFFQNQIALY